MCFFTHYDHKKVKIAEKPIRCWKRFDKWKEKNKWTYCSPYRGTEYQKNTLYYAKLSRVEYFGLSNIGRINKGIHSYSTRTEARECKERDEVIIECTIPVGAKYYYNPTDREYVSDHLYIMKIKYLDCRGKKKLFSLHRHDFRTWEDEDGNFFMIDGGFLDYHRYSHPDMHTLPFDAYVKEDEIENVIEELREQFSWGKNYDKEGNLLPKTQWALLKDLDTDHVINIIKHLYGLQTTNSRTVFVMLEELRYRLKNNMI